MVPFYHVKVGSKEPFGYKDFLGFALLPPDIAE